MTILGVGVDIIFIPRITAALARRGSRFAARILSPEEYSQWFSLPTTDISNRVRFLAVRWCIKEAAYKAMYPFTRPTWKELTYRGRGHILLDSKPAKPALLYHPTSPTDASKIGQTHISVSHDGDYVFASITVEYPNKLDLVHHNQPGI